MSVSLSSGGGEPSDKTNPNGGKVVSEKKCCFEALVPNPVTVFDILTRPGPDLSREERGEIKKVSHLLLDRLRRVLTLDWRKRVDARARVQLAIEDVLDEGLPRACTPELYQGKCKALFEHVYENYVGSGLSVYTSAA
jgi:type I restriction enzyme R subunit